MYCVGKILSRGHGAQSVWSTAGFFSPGGVQMQELREGDLTQLVSVRIWPKADKNRGYKKASYKLLQNLLHANRTDWEASWRSR